LKLILQNRSEDPKPLQDEPEVIQIATEDEGSPVLVRQLDNGEIVFLYEGECYLSVMSADKDNDNELGPASYTDDPAYES
jgi:hypothetical protein